MTGNETQISTRPRISPKKWPASNRNRWPASSEYAFRRYGEPYRAQHTSLSTAHRRVMTAIELCRTAARGGHIEACDQCGRPRIAFKSCRDRYCSRCQSLARAQRLEDRRAELLTPSTFTSSSGFVANPNWSVEVADALRCTHATSRKNCSASDGCPLQAYFACCLRIMWIISIPPRITRADTIDLKPSIDRTRRLTAQWPCSMRLLR